MSTAIPTEELGSSPGPQSASAGDSAVGDGPLEGRGETHVEPKVVEKVVAQAVREVDNATGIARRVLGVSLGSTEEDTGANVSARVDGPTATVAVTMTVNYPASVREVTQQTRQHIRERVLQLTGVHVQQVDITVAGMRVKRPDAPKVR